MLHLEKSAAKLLDKTPATTATSVSDIFELPPDMGNHCDNKNDDDEKKSEDSIDNDIIDVSFLTSKHIDKAIKKTSAAIDMMIRSFPVIFGEADFSACREPLENLERVVYLIDKIVEEGQRLRKPWNIDPLIKQFDVVLQSVVNNENEQSEKQEEIPFLVREMVNHITTYFRLETNVLHSEKPVDIQTIRKVWCYRSNDIRALSLIAMMKMNCYNDIENVNNHILHTVLDGICKVAELSMDARDYESDILDDSFNTYRLFVSLYGPKYAKINIEKEIDSVRQQFEEARQYLNTEQKRNAAKEVFDFWLDGCIKFDYLQLYKQQQVQHQQTQQSVMNDMIPDINHEMKVSEFDDNININVNDDEQQPLQEYVPLGTTVADNIPWSERKYDDIITTIA